jgi:hypothetical protein
VPATRFLAAATAAAAAAAAAATVCVHHRLKNILHTRERYAAKIRTHGKPKGQREGVRLARHAVRAAGEGGILKLAVAVALEDVQQRLHHAPGCCGVGFEHRHRTPPEHRVVVNLSRGDVARWLAKLGHGVDLVRGECDIGSSCLGGSCLLLPSALRHGLSGPSPELLH